MKLTEMVMHGVESGLKLVVVVNGRKLGGGRRDGRASFSMVSADYLSADRAHIPFVFVCMRLVGECAMRRIERYKRLGHHMPPPRRAIRVMARDEKTVDKTPAPECAWLSGARCHGAHERSHAELKASTPAGGPIGRVL